MYGSFFARSLLALSLMAGGACAQTAAPAATAPAAAAPAALSPSHLALGMELVRLSGMSRSIDLIVPETVVRARFALAQLHPKLQDDINKVADSLTPEFVALANEAFQVAGTAFGQKMSEADLLELKTFFMSDVGKRYVAAQPAIIEDMYKQLDQFTAKVSQVVLDRMRDELKKRGHAL